MGFPLECNPTDDKNPLPASCATGAVGDGQACCDALKAQKVDCKDLKEDVADLEALLKLAKEQKEAAEKKKKDATDKLEKAEEQLEELEEQLEDAKGDLEDFFNGIGSGVSTTPGADNAIGVAGSGGDIVWVYFPGSNAAVDGILGALESDYATFDAARTRYNRLLKAIKQKGDDLKLDDLKKNEKQACEDLEKACKRVEDGEKKLEELKKKLEDCLKRCGEMEEKIKEHEETHGPCGPSNPKNPGCDDPEEVEEEPGSTTHRALRNVTQQEREEWGTHWCVPTASGVSAAFFHDTQGVKFIEETDGEEGTSDEDVEEEIDEIGELMGTVPEAGTIFLNAAISWLKYLKKKGHDDKYDVVVYCPNTKKHFQAVLDKNKEPDATNALKKVCEEYDKEKAKLTAANAKQKELIKKEEDAKEAAKDPGLSAEEKAALLKEAQEADNESWDLGDEIGPLETRVRLLAKSKMEWQFIVNALACSDAIDKLVYEEPKNPGQIAKDIKKGSDVLIYVDQHMLAAADPDHSCAEGAGGKCEPNADGTYTIEIYDPLTGKTKERNVRKSEDGNWYIHMSEGDKRLKCWISIRPKEKPKAEGD